MLLVPKNISGSEGLLNSSPSAFLSPVCLSLQQATGWAPAGPPVSSVLSPSVCILSPHIPKQACNTPSLSYHLPGQESPSGIMCQFCTKHSEGLPTPGLSPAAYLPGMGTLHSLHPNSSSHALQAILLVPGPMSSPATLFLPLLSANPNHSYPSKALQV